LLPLDQTLGPKGDAVECVTQHGQVFPTGLSNHKALPLSVEELEAKLSLQSFHLVADGALRHAQLLRGSRKALVPGCGFKGLQSIQGRQAPKHSIP
jgi:hypothetical protein